MFIPPYTEKNGGVNLPSCLGIHRALAKMMFDKTQWNSLPLWILCIRCRIKQNVGLAECQWHKRCVYSPSGDTLPKYL